jgi:four helix bundle protein
MAHFSFEDLDVWRKEVEFAVRVTDVIESLNSDRKHFRLIDQLESASISISMND